VSQGHKPKVTVRIYYQLPPRGWETSPNQVTLDQVRKYLSGKPLRRGPERPVKNDTAGDPDRTDRSPDFDKPGDEEQ
jgi:hypothetical protein